MKFKLLVLIIVLFSLLTPIALSESLMGVVGEGIPTGVQINLDKLDFNATNGGSDEKSFYLYNNGIFSENVTIRNFQGQAGDWITIEKDIGLSPNEPSHRVSVVINVPSDTDMGLYQGTFEIASGEYMRVMKITVNVREKQNIKTLTPMGIIVISFFAVVSMYFISDYFFHKQEREIEKIRKRRHEAKYG